MTKTHPSITSKQEVLKWERKQSLSYIKVRYLLPESMFEGLPFFCGWGWDFSLSLEKEFEGAAGAILRWIFFWVVKLPRLHDAQLWRVFSFKYRSMALCMILMDSSLLVSLFLSVTLARTLYSRPCQVLAAPFVSRYIFQFTMAGSGLAPASEDVRSFTVLLSGSKDWRSSLSFRNCN